MGSYIEPVMGSETHGSRISHMLACMSVMMMGQRVTIAPFRAAKAFVRSLL